MNIVDKENRPECLHVIPSCHANGPSSVIEMTDEKSGL
jgi:hypothetical protein